MKYLFLLFLFFLTILIYFITNKKKYKYLIGLTNSGKSTLFYKNLNKKVKTIHSLKKNIKKINNFYLIDLPYNKINNKILANNFIYFIIDLTELNSSLNKLSNYIKNTNKFNIILTKTDLVKNLDEKKIKNKLINRYNNVKNIYFSNLINYYKIK